MVERKLNYKESFDYITVNNVSENYYPVTSAIYIEDDNITMTLMNDRS